MSPEVVIAVPHTGDIRAELASYLIQVGARHGPIEVWLRNGRPIEHVRNQIVKEFLATDSRWLLFIDSDNPPLSGCDPIEVVDLDLDVIGFPTPIWRSERVPVGAWPLELSAYDTSGENWVEHRPDTRRVIEELDAVGTGCVLIARRVLEHAAMRAPFARAFDVDGLSVQGSDLLFCRRAQAVGFRIFADYSRPCSHLKTVDLVEVNQALGQRDVSQVLVENPNSKRYWDNQWSTRGSRELPFYAELAERLRGKRVLDYGCGRGDLLALLGEHACGYDQSSVAVQICRDRGLAAYSSEDFDSDPLSELGTIWDAIVSTEVLEHLDSDEELLRQFFRWTNDVWYSVPNNCLPPGLEPEHRRVYTHEYIERITPYLRSVKEVGIWLLVHARK